jgi:hypothetical protein
VRADHDAPTLALGWEMIGGPRLRGEERAMNPLALESVDRVEITILMDNVTDPLLIDQEGSRG